MNLRGMFHQVGASTDFVAWKMIEAGFGRGLIFSPADQKRAHAALLAHQIRDYKIERLWDPQFYFTDCHTAGSGTYPTHSFQKPVGELRTLVQTQPDDLCRALEQVNRDLKTTALIAPAVAYEAASTEREDLNANLFGIAQRVADVIGIPVLATVALGKSLIRVDDAAFEHLLASVTRLQAKGWYLNYEFDLDNGGREDPFAVSRCANGCLTLAQHGAPILMGYTGSMSIPAIGWGASAVGVGPHNALSQFLNRHPGQKGRKKVGGRGIKGVSPPRKFYSSALWDFLLFPDDVNLLPSDMAVLLMTHSPYSGPVSDGTGAAIWEITESRKHFLALMNPPIESLCAMPNLRARTMGALSQLEIVIGHWKNLEDKKVPLKNGCTRPYLLAFKEATKALLTTRGEDYDWSEMI